MSSQKNGDESELPESAIAARRDAALLRALSTPHKKQADMKKGKAKGGEVTPSKANEANDRS